MIKTITKIGNSRGIILDAALLEQANLKEGDQVNLTIHEGGTITLVPEMGTVDSQAAKSTAARLIGKNSELFDRLSK